MQTIHVTDNDGIYTCDIGVSQEEWLEILEAPTTRKELVAMLLRFYYMPGHKGTCAQVGKVLSREQGGDDMASSRQVTDHVTQFGVLAEGRLNRFVVVGSDGEPARWLIPMGQGRRLGNGAEGDIEWQLRGKLAGALQTYLYRHLARRYKALRKEKLRIDAPERGEIYKWQLIKDCKGKDVEYVAQRLCTENLIDRNRDAAIIKYMLANKREEYVDILSRLVNSTPSLHERLQGFKRSMEAAMPEMLNGKRIASKANDERMASAFLTCHSPADYTFYKYDVYVKLCDYLGVRSRYAGDCLEHFLDLLRPLQQTIEQDDELQEIVADSLKAYDRNTLLLAQDVLWEMLVTFPGRLDFVYPLVWPPRHWFVGFNFGGKESQLDRFINEGIWEGRFEKNNKQYKQAKKIKEGDILILKSTFTKGENHDKPCLRISAIAIVTDCEDDTTDKAGTRVKRKVKYVSRDKVDFDGKRYGRYLSTVEECDVDAVIDYVNKIRNMVPQKRYSKYTELLRANHNIILTGAPGTGKTYMAKAIAKEMGAECEFVQFHPSYDYTDFVEGLRPKEDGNGNVGFERRDGVFKAFCAKALENYLDSKKSKEALQQETTAKELLEDFINEAMEEQEQFETAGTRNAFHIAENREHSVIVEVPGNAKTKQVRLSKSEFLTLMDNKVSITAKKDLQEYFHRKYVTQQDSYTYVLYDILRRRSAKQATKTVQQVALKPFVFIIDEINRGEISKVFGELFYSIDPGYRGHDGRVKTQYQNMIEEGDAFQEGFFVPENVYIIGTMNDIDRSVESMDFAMRRRFAWQEVTAEESYEAMIAHDAEFTSLKDEIHARMTHLNRAILDVTLRLGKAYQIGAAYFRKVAEYDKSHPGSAFDMLWENHLSGLLAEYLRGSRNAGEQLKRLHDAYNKTQIEDDALSQG